MTVDIRAFFRNIRIRTKLLALTFLPMIGLMTAFLPNLKSARHS